VAKVKFEMDKDQEANEDVNIFIVILFIVKFVMYYMWEGSHMFMSL
jgi:hypothetical protein